MTDSIRIVQFLHPGPEHRPGPDGGKPWNSKRNDHRRTFVRRPGRFQSATDGQPQTAELDFWCEWEPEADVITKIASRVAEGPRYLFMPRFMPKSRYEHLHNTDPCVFGGFYYCYCKQQGVMKRLDRGSVVLFGSCLDHRFILDTVFVVTSHDEFDRLSFEKLDVSEEYRAIALRPIFSGAGQAKECAPREPVESFRLYRGATADDPVDGMFSFFPCMPASNDPSFARPTIRLPGYITDNHKQGIRTTVVDMATAGKLWHEVVEQVLDTRLFLGVEADMPRHQAQGA